MNQSKKDNTILIDSSGRRFKIFKITPHSDGGFDVHIPYHRDKTGYLFKICMPYVDGQSYVPTTAIAEQKVINKDVKLSIHTSGFVQFSGKNVISGIDKRTKQPKGLAIKIPPLTTPIVTGPTFGVSAWGLEDFEELRGGKSGKNYITFTPNEFYPDPPSTKNPNTFAFECFLFKISESGRVVQTVDGEAILETSLPQYIYDRRKIFKLKVVSLKNSPVFVAILPTVRKSSGLPKSGYGVDGPSQLATFTVVGSTPEHLICKAGNYMHLKAAYPPPDFVKRLGKVSSLEFKDSWLRRLSLFLKRVRG